MNIRWLVKGYPIAFTQDGSLFYYWKGWVYCLSDNKSEKYCRFKRSLYNCIIEFFPYLRRLFRVEIRCSCVVENTVFFFKNKKLFCLDLLNKSLTHVYSISKEKSTPLNILPVNTDKVVLLFGDYYSNYKYEAVNIYALTSEFTVDVLFSFKPGTIRHIHNIIESDGGYYIFTGDNEEEAGIYYADYGFETVKKVSTGNWRSRAVIGFAYNKILVYATDSVERRNSLILLKDGHSFEIAELNGSVIYGGQTQNYMYFSTTVESSEDNKASKLKKLISTKRANGIISDNVELVQVNKKDLSITIPLRIKKDKLPYKLFQYGSFRIVSGQDKIAFCPIATKTNSELIGVIEEVCDS